MEKIIVFVKIFKRAQKIISGINFEKFFEVGILLNAPELCNKIIIRKFKLKLSGGKFRNIDS